MSVVSYSDNYVQYVNSNGNVNYNDYNWNYGVRPFWGGRCNKVSIKLKLESRHQKNRQPFLVKQDKHKGFTFMTDFEKIVSFENLYKAYKKAKSGKRFTQSGAKFHTFALDKICQLKVQLETKTYQISPYNQFKVYEPKERLIKACSFRDKVVQHSLCDNVLLPNLKNEFIQTNYAGQVGKGTLYGLDCLSEHMQAAYNEYGYDCWIIKADISKYFYSINHALLKDIVEYFVLDKDVYWLCEKFIDSTEGIGLPLGNQVSQVFALMYLSGLDHFITDELHVKYYGRYMDDFYLIVKDKSDAKECLEFIREFVASLKLDLNGKTQVIPFKNGLKFCGFHTYITKSGKVIRKLKNESKRTAKKKFRKMVLLVNQGKLSMDKFNESYNSWLNHISHGNCYKLSANMNTYIDSLFTTHPTHNKGITKHQ